MIPIEDLTDVALAIEDTDDNDDNDDDNDDYDHNDDDNDDNVFFFFPKSENFPKIW